MTDPVPTPGAQRVQAALRRLELYITRRLDGMLQGDYRGLVPGAGTEPGESRLYQPGDDVRLIDWSVTARTTVPHVRMPVAEHELEAWLVVDASASLDFGTAEHTKFELAVAAAAAVGFLTRRSGNRIGGLLLHGDRRERVPARTGRAHLMALLERLARAPLTGGAGPVDLAAGVHEAGRLARRRGLVAIVSDFLVPGDELQHRPSGSRSGGAQWMEAVRRLASRHEVLAVEVVDPRELALPDVGMLRLADPETGRTRLVQTGSRRLRERYERVAAEQRAAVAAALRRAGAHHLTLRTDRDWLLDVVRFVDQRRGLARAAQRAARR